MSNYWLQSLEKEQTTLKYAAWLHSVQSFQCFRLGETTNNQRPYSTVQSALTLHPLTVESKSTDDIVVLESGREAYISSNK